MGTALRYGLTGPVVRQPVRPIRPIDLLRLLQHQVKTGDERQAEAARRQQRAIAAANSIRRKVWN